MNSVMNSSSRETTFERPFKNADPGWICSEFIRPGSQSRAGAGLPITRPGSRDRFDLPQDWRQRTPYTGRNAVKVLSYSDVGRMRQNGSKGPYVHRRTGHRNGIVRASQKKGPIGAEAPRDQDRVGDDSRKASYSYLCAFFPWERLHHCSKPGL